MARDGLWLEGIAKRFGRKWALRGLTLQAEAGTALALMGRNGSGKTTLLRVLATSLRPTRGRGQVFGRDLVRDAAAIREQVGTLYHQAGVYGDLTARENLEFARRMFGGRAVVGVDEALDRVGLAHAANERVAGFSSGMTRRLALARLVMRPARLLLLDEPYASFDADGIELVNELVQEAASRGGLALIATHDPERSAGIVDGIVTLREGRVVPAPSPRQGLWTAEALR